MKFEVEQRLRNEAQCLRQQGYPGWAYGLITNGLDPERWSDMPSDVRGAEIRSQSFDAASNTIDICFASTTPVLRQDIGGSFNEILQISHSAMRLSRLNGGSAPFLKSHSSHSLDDILGSIIAGSVRLNGNRATCRVLLSCDPINAGLIGDIKSGVIRSCSVGYTIHDSVWTQGRNGGPDIRTVTDWEPLEVSAVAIPADATSSIRKTAA